MRMRLVAIGSALVGVLARHEPPVGSRSMCHRWQGCNAPPARELRHAGGAPTGSGTLGLLSAATCINRAIGCASCIFRCFEAPGEGQAAPSTSERWPTECSALRRGPYCATPGSATL